MACLPAWFRRLYMYKWFIGVILIRMTMRFGILIHYKAFDNTYFAHPFSPSNTSMFFNTPLDTWPRLIAVRAYDILDNMLEAISGIAEAGITFNFLNPNDLNRVPWGTAAMFSTLSYADSSTAWILDMHMLLNSFGFWLDDFLVNALGAIIGIYVIDRIKVRELRKKIKELQAEIEKIRKIVEQNTEISARLPIAGPYMDLSMVISLLVDQQTDRMKKCEDDVRNYRDLLGETPKNSENSTEATRLLPVARESGSNEVSDLA